MKNKADKPPLTTYQAPYRAPVLASLMLLLTLLQGTSTTLTLAIRSPFATEQLASMVSTFWLVMYLVALAGLMVTQGINWVTWMVRYRLPLVILLAGTAFSTVWSVDTNLTMERSIHLLGTSTLALYIGFSLPLARILRTSGIVLGLLMLASVLSAFFLPSLGLLEYEGQPVWAGVMASKNTLGFWAAISVLLLVSLCFWPVSTPRRLMYLTLAGAGLLCLYFSASATSVLALISAALIMLYLYCALNLQLSMLATVMLGLLVVSLLSMAFLFIDTAELIGRSGDMTGRSDVWRQTWDLIKSRPLTGYGYGTIWYPTEESVKIQQALTDFTWTVYHAHNGFLQIASEVGLPLAVVALFMVLQQLVELIYCQYQRQQPGVLFVMGFMIALLVSNYSEARLLVNKELYWIFFLALPISMLQQVTLTVTHSRGIRIPFTLPPRINDKLARSREQLTHRRSLKKRLDQRRRNGFTQPTIGHEGSLTDSRGNSLFASASLSAQHDDPTTQAANSEWPEKPVSETDDSNVIPRGEDHSKTDTGVNDGHDHSYGEDADKRLLARRQHKAD